MSFLERQVLPHCSRCDRVSQYLVQFLSPDNQTEQVCWKCVKREDKRHHRFSPAWKRQRRPTRRVAVNTS
jgi:hypothetical protein